MESSPSDEEVFTGPFTIKEVRRRITFSKRKTFSGLDTTENEGTRKCVDDIKIIQTRSEPDLMSESRICLVQSPTDHTISKEDYKNPLQNIEHKYNYNNDYTISNCDSPICTVPDLLTESSITLVESPPELTIIIDDSPKSMEGSDYKDNLKLDTSVTMCDGPNQISNFHKKDYLDLEETVDESFLKLEQMVSDLCVEDGKADLDNTLEVVEFILKHGPGESVACDSVPNNTPAKNNATQIFHSTQMEDAKPKNLQEFSESLLNAHDLNSLKLNKFDSQESLDTDIFTTPVDKMKHRTPIFKTPANPASQCKQLGTSTRHNAYQHIASPISLYINKSPRVPLLKDVKPKKPLPSTSSIPKLVKSLSQNSLSNKENVNLPTLAYKSAKKTKVIDIPDKNKLPQSQWAKKVSTSLPRPMVVKHKHRENNLTHQPGAGRPLHEDSFGDLPLRQADVSVCTQQSARKETK